LNSPRARAELAELLAFAHARRLGASGVEDALARLHGLGEVTLTCTGAAATLRYRCTLQGRGGVDAVLSASGRSAAAAALRCLLKADEQLRRLHEHALAELGRALADTAGA
jgi:hypothetical protein